MKQLKKGNQQNKNTEALVLTGPAKLLEMAINKGVDVEQLGKLMDLQERWESKEANKAFLISITGFQSECPVMKKDKKVSFVSQRTGKKTEYSYASLGSIVNQIKSLLKKHGLSYRWEATEIDGKISIKCITSHVDGHSEGNSMSASKDDSGNKNQIQQIGSAMTYLQRYTLIGAFGISTADEDSDMQNIDPPKVKTQIKISKVKSEDLLDKAKMIIDEYTNHKDLMTKYKSFAKDQFKAGMHQEHIDDLKKYINVKSVSLKKANQTKPVTLP